MKKPKPTSGLILGSAMLFSSCVGSFGTWNQLKNWNEEVEDNFMNKFIFYAARVIPVYEICYLTDLIVLNPIEYWKGMNPIAAAESIQIVKNEIGEYAILTTNIGYTIYQRSMEETPLHLIYNQNKDDWFTIINGKLHTHPTINESGTVTVEMPDGTKITVNPSEEGKKAIILSEGQKLIK